MSKTTLHTGIAVATTLLVVGVFFILGIPFSASPLNSQPAAVAATQVTVQDEVVGKGVAAKTGDTVVLNYTGKFQDGSVFDTSVGKAPISFTLGQGQVIPGMEQGLAGVQAGGKRMIVIPPSLAYGENDYGPIPGNSTLVFDVEVLSVISAQ